MSIIRPRSEWTSTKEGFNVALKAGTVEGVAIHYPGIGNVTTAGNSDEWAKAQLRAYRNWHITGRGWPDIGYNVAISQNGTAWWAAGKKKAAHCASTANPYANAKFFGILLIVGNSERPTVNMLATLNRVIAEVRGVYSGATKILGHREVYGASTACPGTVILGLIHDGTIRASSSGGIGGGMAPIVVAPNPAPATVIPTPPAAPTTTEQEDHVLFIARQKDSPDQYIGDGITARHIGPEQEKADLLWQLRDAGVKVIDRGPVTRIEWLGKVVA